MPDDPQNLQTNPVEGDETLWGYLALLDDPDYDYYINNQDVSPKDKAKLLEIFLNQYADNMAKIYNDFIANLAAIKAEAGISEAPQVLKENNDGEK